MVGMSRFFGLFKRAKNSNENGASSKNGAKTTFHRSHYIKKHPDHDDMWGTTIAGQPVVGKLDNVIKSINTWYETRVIVPPEHFESLPGRPTERQIVEYNGFKIINDRGGDHDWYVIHKNKLLKGSRSAIERKIDGAILRAKAKKEARIQESINMAKDLKQEDSKESMQDTAA
jgi:hypothetical protein